MVSEALALWEGDALQEFVAEDCASAKVARLEEAHLAAIESPILRDMAWKDTDELIPEIEALERRFLLSPSSRTAC